MVSLEPPLANKRHNVVTDYVKEEESMSISSTRKVFVTLMLLATAFTVSCTALREKRSTLTVSEPAQSIEEKRGYLTVSEALQHAESLDGKQVRVRGYGFFIINTTLLICPPGRCDCNQTSGVLVLLEEELYPEDYHRLDDLASIYISESSLKCQGNDCSVDCTPFDPSTAKEFEFEGVLKIDHTSDPNRLILQNLDLEASRQLIGDEWIPIETGRFTVELGKK